MRRDLSTNAKLLVLGHCEPFTFLLCIFLLDEKTMCIYEYISFLSFLLTGRRLFALFSYRIDEIASI
jgi:hypothetical protein